MDRFNAAVRRGFVTAFSLVALTGISGTLNPAPARADETQPVAFVTPTPKLIGGAKEWLNTGGKPLTLKKGTVYILHFWTFGCINCKHNLPSYAKWQKRFAKKNITIVGVHTPETEEEMVTANVVRRVKALGITYPTLLDQHGKNWRRWEQQYWPTVYLIDKQGNVRYRWEGELEYNQAGGEEKMAKLAEQLLQETL